MDLRLVEYAVYLPLGVWLTLWVGRAFQRSGESFLAETLSDPALAEPLNRLLVIGFHLVGLGGVALLLQVDGSLGSAADVMRAVATKLGLVLLLLGGLHVVNLMVLHRLHRPAEPADRAEATRLRRVERWP
jgi:hypothetical protein